MKQENPARFFLHEEISSNNNCCTSLGLTSQLYKYMIQLKGDHVQMSQKVLDENRVVVGVSMTPTQRETIRAFAADHDLTFSSAIRNLALEAMRLRQTREHVAA